jgi:hypothetical protein
MAEWRSRADLEDHFRKHGARVGVRTVEEYEASSREVIDIGTYLEYRDRETGAWRVGYYDRATERFVAVTGDELEIVSHFRADERYVSGLWRSTYA